jgi:hypothetical protein
MTTKSRQRTTDGSAPDLLTIEEAARILWIGRTKTYELARCWLKTGGTEGLPAVRVGHQLRVQRCGVEELIGGPITWPIPDEPTDETPPAPVTEIRSRPIRRRKPPSGQQSLPYSS